MLLADRCFALLLILGGIGHTLGSLSFYKSDPLTLLWSLSASLFVFLLGAIHLLRISRPADKPLAAICLMATLCWIVVTVRFGQLIHNLVDPRVLIFGIICAALSLFSIRTIGGRVQR